MLSLPEVRKVYKDLLREIGAREDELVREGLGIGDRARICFELRKFSRVACRRLMEKEWVEYARARDSKKYGSSDGPTFSDLMRRARRRGLTAAEAYHAIIESAQRSDESVDRALE